MPSIDRGDIVTDMLFLRASSRVWVTAACASREHAYYECGQVRKRLGDRSDQRHALACSHDRGLLRPAVRSRSRCRGPVMFVGTVIGSVLFQALRGPRARCAGARHKAIGVVFGNRLRGSL